MPLNSAFYPDKYLSAASSTRGGAIRIVAVPEKHGENDYSPCAYIRVLQPLDYLCELGLIEFVIASADQAHNCRADVLFCHRTSGCDVAQAEALKSYARRNGIPLLYDIDDNLVEIDKNHPERLGLETNVPVILTFLRNADAVFFSTARLLEQLGGFCSRPMVLGNALDQRLLPKVYGRNRSEPVFKNRQRVGILYMGTQTHAPDFDLVSSSLSRLALEFQERVRVGLIGVTASSNLPFGIQRVRIPESVGSSYPAFMSWLAAQRDWHIGIAPLRETRFNDAKSMVKVLDYSTMGAMPVVSDVPAYEEIPSGAALKVTNTSDNWYTALRSAVTDDNMRNTISEAAYKRLFCEYTLSSQLDTRIEALAIALGG